ERFGAPRGYFLSVGTLEPRKNLELVLDAWPAVRAEPEGASAILLLAGPDGWKNRSLQRRVERLAPLGVRRLGRVPPSDLVELYRGALALVYPSRYEGFGLPVAEALACGVPAVVAEDTSPAEVAGDAGVTCDPDSPDALAAVLLDLLGNAERTRALATRAAARGRRFSWPVAAAAHSAVFREALGAEPA
ncbi:MAG TPA: glycosyltransferase, partial [Thermoanaerobaculia bacterium]|nr:glycosyltransferase [Thermoanaerobaculia bacterium]